MVKNPVSSLKAANILIEEFNPSMMLKDIVAFLLAQKELKEMVIKNVLYSNGCNSITEGRHSGKLIDIIDYDDFYVQFIFSIDGINTFLLYNFCSADLSSGKLISASKKYGEIFPIIVCQLDGHSYITNVIGLFS